MAKSKLSLYSPRPKQGKLGDGKFVDRDLSKVNPIKEQFEPTDSAPVNQHKKMAGAC